MPNVSDPFHNIRQMTSLLLKLITDSCELANGGSASWRPVHMGVKHQARLSHTQPPLNLTL